MPIRPENRARYPKDWKDVRARILERAGNRCEGSPAYPDCRAPNGSEIRSLTRRVVVLTIGHLGRAAHLPMGLHVTRAAKTDEVFQVVGLLVRPESELPEWHHMMHSRALAEFRRMAPAVSAPFVITLPSCFASRYPRWPVAHKASAVSPEHAILTRWRLFGKPFEPTRIATEAAAFFNVPSADGISFAAPFTENLREAALTATDGFVATARRASLDVVGRLLGADREDESTYDALTFGRAFAWSGHTSLYHMDEYPENCADENLKAWCQRCHLTYDAKHHARTAAATRRRRLNNGDLFPVST